jgi:hypothetical protein
MPRTWERNRLRQELEQIRREMDESCSLEDAEKLRGLGLRLIQVEREIQATKEVK